MPTKDSESLLDHLIVAAPCQVPWASMVGTDRVRDCSYCSRKVYNISDMTRREAEAFLSANGTSHCATFYRRADGTIVTDNCPAGLRKLRDRYRSIAKIAGSVIAFIVALPAALAEEHKPSTPSPAQPQHIEGMSTRGVIRFIPPVDTPAQPNYTRALGGAILRPGIIKQPDPPSFKHGKNGLPDDDAVFGSGTIHLRAEKGIGPDSRAYHQYLRAIENEDKGRHFVAATYYKDALRMMGEAALENLNNNQSAYDPRLKQAIEEHLLRLQNMFGLGQIVPELGAEKESQPMQGNEPASNDESADERPLGVYSDNGGPPASENDGRSNINVEDDSR